MFLTVVFDLVGDGGRIFLDKPGYGLERHTLSEALLKLLAVFHGKVFVFLKIRFISHLCGLLSGSLFPRVNSTTNGVSK